ncbi:hypothetical protein [Paenibacillus motobuensis]|uniref:Uncharacterized protein n=1 Tax=Paenibacillus motobuensis TaxID=295324 RepID=A0ABN0YUE4_9BACL
MENEAELTRRYLLNSHSRGSLEEVVSEDEQLELADGREQAIQISEDIPPTLFEEEQSGKEKIAYYLRQYYS